MDDEEYDLWHDDIVRSIQAAGDVLMERNRTTREALYWKYTNNVRRNLLMAVVKREIAERWRPGEGRDQNLADLRTMALRRLTAAVANHIDSGLSPPASPPHEY